MANLNLEVDMASIVKKPDYEFNPYVEFRAILHTEKKDLSKKDTVAVNKLIINRDYSKSISDYIEVEVIIPYGTYRYDVEPYLDNLELTLIKVLQNRVPQAKNELVKKYKAVFLLDKNKNIPNIMQGNLSDLNNLPPVTLTLQLLDRFTEVYRIKTTSGSFDPGVIKENKNLDIQTFLATVLETEAKKIKIEGKNEIDTIDIEKPDNTEKLKSLHLPSYTRVVTIADYLQNHNVGVYLGDIGFFIQNYLNTKNENKKGIFVYSVYNSAKYDNAKFKFHIYVSKDAKYASVEKSYDVQDKLLRAVCYSPRSILDNKESSMMSTGSGYRISNASTYMSKPVVMTEEGPVFDRRIFAKEVVHKDRKDNLNFAPRKGVVYNQYKISTENAATFNSFAIITINNFEPDYLTPMFKGKILYQNLDNKIEQKTFTILSINTVYIPLQKNPMELFNISKNFFTCTSELKISIAGVEEIKN